jgi:hypothetical protein
MLRTKINLLKKEHQFLCDIPILELSVDGENYTQREIRKEFNKVSRCRC